MSEPLPSEKERRRRRPEKKRDAHRLIDVPRWHSTNWTRFRARIIVRFYKKMDISVLCRAFRLTTRNKLIKDCCQRDFDREVVRCLLQVKSIRVDAGTQHRWEGAKNWLSPRRRRVCEAITIKSDATENSNNSVSLRALSAGPCCHGSDSARSMRTSRSWASHHSYLRQKRRKRGGGREGGGGGCSSHRGAKLTFRINEFVPFHVFIRPVWCLNG